MAKIDFSKYNKVQKKITKYLKKEVSAGDIKPKNSTLKPKFNANLNSKTKNSTLDSKLNKETKKIYAHNYSLKFLLKENCEIPYSKSFFNYNKLPRGEFNVRYDFRESKGFVRQTNKSLIVFPYLEKDWALPLNSHKLKNRLADKAFTIVRDLQAKHKGLLVDFSSVKLSTQEYAIKDSYAKELDYTLKVNDDAEGSITGEPFKPIAQIDKSIHVDETGHENSGGEIDWKAPLFADAYVKMPIVFMKGMKSFEKMTVMYNKNLGLHIEVQKEQLITQKSIQRSLGGRHRFPTNFKNSATARGVN